ncbi:sel1 repeat family protein [Pararhizobium sp.]|uniref:sel1 repeat family protein n=1 Tax=Pararhizobium sp. TaxID=1977563 RepID=UPI002722947E|nr:sel1 repeat family protein [Pararhizobium sp.]MDO9418779.1 sel1 repeat family protein [Pararhizobium sp.]
MKHRLLTLTAFLMLLAGGGFAARAQDAAKPVVPDMTAISAAIDADSEIKANHALCPADAFKGSRPYWRMLLSSTARTEKTCAADLALCLDDCRVKRNENACFAMARIFQEREETGTAPKYAQMMFAQACATGSPGGCTNRAASIRNARPVGDPFDGVETEVQNTCLFRSFDTACSNEDAWGCAMLGQSHQTGQGIAQNSAKARTAYEKACVISPDFPACDYAKSLMEELK